MTEPRTSTPSSTWAQVCKDCGQTHAAQENHLYEYRDEVDDELVCHICLQPLLRPMDTPCGHTYCYQCLGSFLREQDFCPVDRQRLQLAQCRPSSLLVRNLLDKLGVLCPFQPCGQQMQRCELQPHLLNRCPGFRKLREESEKKKRPPWNDLKGSKTEVEPSGGTTASRSGSSRSPGEPGLVNPAFEESEDDAPMRCSLVAETNVVEIFRTEPEEELGIHVVGGKDTPLGNIVIQDIVRDSLAARDGKLAPGDHILEVNDVSVASISHARAVAVLRRSCPVVRFTVMQEKGFSTRNPRPEHHPGSAPTASAPAGPGPAPFGTVIQVTLMKRDRSEPLGIKLIRKSEEPGVFILDLLPGGLAAKDGKLRNSDKVLAINGQDLRHGTPESAAQIIQASEMRVNFVVLRHAEPQGEAVVSGEGLLRGTRRNSDLHYFRRRSTYVKDPPDGFSSQEKTVSIKKEPRHSLGITIAGGRDSRSHVPIYITSVQPVGCLHRDGTIKAGDVLLSINGVDLTQLTYTEAVRVLKAQASQPNVVLRVVETVSGTLTEEDGDGVNWEELEPLENPREDDLNWAPLWTRWLGLPRPLKKTNATTTEVYTRDEPFSPLHWCRDIVLQKTNSESWGFSIVGGYEENHGQQPFFIKTIVPGTPAHFDGRLKCGDEIVAVNGATTVGMNNSSLIPLLKLQRNKVTLTVVSWPGSLV